MIWSYTGSASFTSLSESPKDDLIRDMKKALEDALETLERYGWWHEQQAQIRDVLSRAEQFEGK